VRAVAHRVASLRRNTALKLRLLSGHCGPGPSAGTDRLGRE